MHWIQSHGIPAGCLKSLEYPRTGRPEVIAALTILSARSGLALTALPTIAHAAAEFERTITELNAAKNCSADAVWMVAPDAATARANSSLARPCCIATSSSISE